MTAVAEFAIPRDVELPSVSLTLPAVLSSARQARNFTAESLRFWGESEDLIDSAVLIVCELATNAIRHGARLPAAYGRERGTDAVITLRLALRADVLHIEVHDGSMILPVQRAAGHDEDCGRGMQIIAALAESWTCGRDPEGGKWVRATLSRGGGAADG
ncbi:anti-sigma regulatory factor (Ser/Thr protein kinase) [Streptomyces sp. 2333.5]|nr:anti-sigma regulatory factor (Ser/Thr protein kinase) [Streptomyces sp. 2333.5]SEC72555.1 Anti-sigma regulatory factor (Ser/Thr protein kinase) [Streptomyces sp. 2112.2]